MISALEMTVAGFTDQVVASKSCHPEVDLDLICTGSNPQVVRRESYSYDLVGNRTDSATAVASGNRLLNFHGFTLTYDADGNLVRKVKRPYIGTVCFRGSDQPRFCGLAFGVISRQLRGHRW